MASSYGKNTCFHEIIGFITLIAMITSFLILDNKPCSIPLLPREELPNWSKPITGTEISTKVLRAKNQTRLADEIVGFVESYYQYPQIYHLTMVGWSCFIIMLGFVNIIPRHEDLKVFTILLLVILMGSMALLSFCMAFYSFHKPCRAIPGTIQVTRSHYHYLRSKLINGLMVLFQNQTQPTPILTTENKSDQSSRSSSSLSIPSSSSSSTASSASASASLKNYVLEFRSIKDIRPVNVYEDDDETLIQVIMIDSIIGFILLFSDFLFFFDSRQHMIEWRN